MSISTRKLSVGQKVMVQCTDEDKLEANGHVCVITRVGNTIFKQSSEYKYALMWFKEDNPGRRWPRCLQGSFYYLDDEVVPLNASLPLSSALLQDFPDV